GAAPRQLAKSELRARLAPLIEEIPPIQRNHPAGPFYAIQRTHQIEYIRASNLLDRQFYIGQIRSVPKKFRDAVEHFHDVGYLRGIKPNLYFDPKWYLQTYPDVAERGFNPLYHYAKWGE